MAAVWYRARGDLGRRLGSTLLLIVLVAVAGGTVMAAVAGAQRTRDALPEFLAYNEGYDTAVFVNPTLPAEQQAALLDQVAALPLWENQVRSTAALYTVVLPDGTGSGLVASQSAGGDDYLREIERPIVVAGRLPDPDSATHVSMNEAMAEALELEVGDRFTMRTISPGNREAAANGELTSDPEGQDVDMTVAAIVRQPVDLGRDEYGDQAAIQYSTDDWQVWPGAGVWEAIDGNTATYGSGVIGQLADDATIEDLEAAAADLDPENLYVERNSTEDEQIASVSRAIGLEADALLLFGGVVLVAATVLVGQAVAREASADLEDTMLLEAIGMPRWQRACVPMLRAGLIALGGAAVAALIAVAASPIAPLGIARQAELNRGVEASAPVLGTGIGIVILAVLLRSAVACWVAAAPESRRAGTPRPTRSLAAALLSPLALPYTLGAGVRMAFEAGRGRRAVPVRRGLAAATAGVIALVAILVFVTSFDRILASPELQGWTWDLSVGNYGDPESSAEGAATLDGIDGIASYVGMTSQPVTIEGEDTAVAAMGPGELSGGPQPLTGRLPAADDEIALATGTLQDADKQLGDAVEVRTETGTTLDLTVVGTVTPPASLDDVFGLDRGGVMTLSGLEQALGPGVPQQYLVTVADGPEGDAALVAVRDQFGESIADSRVPGDYENVRRVSALPWLLALVVGTLAVGTLANTLVTSVRRRRRELATLAAIGFHPRQLASAVGWQAITFAVVALVIGIPLGLMLGRVVFAAIMDRLGSAVSATSAWPELALFAAGTVTVVCLIAAVPAWSAAHARPAEGLRAE